MQNKIDFTLFVSVTKANPNGDPLANNRPRVDLFGHGQISDVALKRKIRNRLQDLGNEIFIKSKDRVDDGYNSLYDRLNANEDMVNLIKDNNVPEFSKKALEKWIDVRLFGQVFSFNKGFSVGLRGPVTIQTAVSVDPVIVTDSMITKSTKGSSNHDTMGQKSYVEFGLYQINGSINATYAEKNGITSEDVQMFKLALETLFENDASSARPEGSVILERMYWWEHPNKNGIYPSIKVHRSISAKLKEKNTIPRTVEDYKFRISNLKNLELTKLEM